MVRPEINRPSHSHQRFGASAINRKSRPNPVQEIKSTGLRPKRSERTPAMGENRNCISAQLALNTPRIPAALAVLPLNCSTSFGKTGMIMPNERTSSTTKA